MKSTHVHDNAELGFVIMSPPGNAGNNAARKSAPANKAILLRKVLDGHQTG